MHLATLRTADGPQAAVKVGSHILDLKKSALLAPEAQALPASVRGILEGGDQMMHLVRDLRDKVASDTQLAQNLTSAKALILEQEAQFLAPIPDPVLVLSCGRNYRSHLLEMVKGDAAIVAAMVKNASPTGFIKNSAAIIGPGQSIVLPATYPDMVDWEAEFCAVIGRACHNVSVDEALNYVAGYTMINDVSARDFIPKPGSDGKIAMTPDIAEMNLHGKQFPTFCPMGPYVATKDEIVDPDKVSFTLSINKEVMQSASTDDLIFTLADLISFFSTFYAFQPGDVISSGSPAGVGYGRDPRRFLRPGDVVEIGCDGLGSFKTPVSGATKSA